MATTTVDAVCSETESNLAAYLEELKLSGPHWETKPESGEGEDAWSPRQVAEHLAGAATFFAAGIAFNLKLEGPERAPAVCETAEAAATATERNHEALLKVMRQVRDEQLDQIVVAPQLGGEIPLERVMLIIPAHLKDHAQQLRTLRGA